MSEKNCYNCGGVSVFIYLLCVHAKFKFTSFKLFTIYTVLFSVNNNRPGILQETARIPVLRVMTERRLTVRRGSTVVASTVDSSDTLLMTARSPVMTRLATTVETRGILQEIVLNLELLEELRRRNDDDDGTIGGYYCSSFFH